MVTSPGALDEIPEPMVIAPLRWRSDLEQPVPDLRDRFTVCGNLVVLRGCVHRHLWILLCELSLA
jgi:hypothetical protein